MQKNLISSDSEKSWNLFSSFHLSYCLYLHDIQKVMYMYEMEKKLAFVFVKRNIHVDVSYF